MRGGDWIAPLEESIEVTDLAYMSTNVPHIIDTLHVVNLIAERYKNRKCVMGLEPGMHIQYFVFCYYKPFSGVRALKGCSQENILLFVLPP